MKFLMALFLSFLVLPALALTVGAYNIRNFDYDQRYRISTNKPELSNIIKELNVDLLSIEEINQAEEFEQFVSMNLPDYGVKLSRCGGLHGQKLGFIYNKKTIRLLSFHEDLSITDPGKQPTCDTASRPLAIGLFEIKESNQRFYGLTAHLKSGSDPSALKKRQKQFEILKKIILELKSKTGVSELFLAGDLNTTEYLSKGADYLTLNKFIKDLDLKLLTKKLACSAYWWGGSDDGIETPSLLDHVIVSKGLLKRNAQAESKAHCQLVKCQMVPTQDLGKSYESVSDHCPVTAEIQ